MLRRLISLSRYIVLIAVLGTFAASLALLLYEASVFAITVVDVIREYSASPAAAKTFAVGLIEAVDVFLIAIVVYIISLGLYTLFVDETLPLPHWLEINNLEDLKNNLVSVVIAVLAVLFLSEAMAWETGSDVLMFGAAVAIVIGALTLFLTKDRGKED